MNNPLTVDTDEELRKKIANCNPIKGLLGKYYKEVEDDLVSLIKADRDLAVVEARKQAALKQTRRIRRHIISVWGRTLDVGFFKEEEKWLLKDLQSQSKGETHNAEQASRYWDKGAYSPQEGSE